MPVWQECQPPKNPYKVTLCFTMDKKLPVYSNPLNLPESEALELQTFAEMAELGCTLQRDEVDKVLKRVPLIVLADDEPGLRNLFFDVMTMSRERTDSIVKLEGDMQKCFEALPNIKPDELPFILCHNGAQAEQATMELCNRQIGNGLLMFDHKMGFPDGLEIFQKLNGKFPQTTTRALISGTMPPDTDRCLRTNIIDVAIPKPPSMQGMRADLASAYLKKIYAAQK